MGLIGVDEAFFFTILYGFVGVLLALICVVVTWILVWFKYVPRAARQMSKAAHRRWPLNIVFFDEGFAEIVAGKKFTEEVIQNPDDSYGVLPGRAPLQVTPQFNPLVNVPDDDIKKWIAKGLVNADGKASLEQVQSLEHLGLLPAGTVQAMQSFPSFAEQTKTQTVINEIATKRFYERSMGVPLWIQYAPKGIVMNAETLAMIQDGKRLGLLLNPLLTKEWFGRMWLSSRLKNIARMNQEIGWRKARALVGKWEKWMPLFIVLALIALIGIIILGIHYA